MGHRNFCCDGCQTHNFHGRRFHCLRCVNYDLCGDCYDQHVETLDHRVEHPMQLLLEQDNSRPQHQHQHQHQQQLPELLLNGELLELMHVPNCYTCPYCGIFGHTAKELIDHVVTVHRQADGHVVCPMCAGLPGFELVTIRNLARHLLLNHIEHANLLDPHTPPLRHALARVSRRRRRQQPLGPALQSGGNRNSISNPITNANLNLNLNPNQGAARANANNNNVRPDSEAGIDILYQLSELRRLRPELRLSQTPANYLAGDPRTRPNTLAIAIPESLLAASQAGEAANPAMLLEHPMSNSNSERFLLQQWMAEQHADLEAALRDNGQRQQHALFTEHLLLSMMCEEQLQLPQHQEPKPNLESELESEPERERERELGPPVEEERSLDQKNEDLSSLLHTPCKYVPSQIMMLMSLPWIRPRSAEGKLRYIELQGVTLDESGTSGVEQQDID